MSARWELSPKATLITLLTPMYVLTVVHAPMSAQVLRFIQHNGIKKRVKALVPNGTGAFCVQKVFCCVCCRAGRLAGVGRAKERVSVSATSAPVIEKEGADFLEV